MQAVFLLLRVVVFILVGVRLAHGGAQGEEDEDELKSRNILYVITNRDSPL